MGIRCNINKIKEITRRRRKERNKSPHQESARNIDDIALEQRLDTKVVTLTKEVDLIITERKRKKNPHNRPKKTGFLQFSF